MSQHIKNYCVFAILVICAQGVASVLLGRGPQLTAFGDLIQSICLLAAFVFVVPNIISSRRRARAFWVLVFLGFGFWFAFQLLWDYFEVVLRLEVPDPFVGDILLFLHIVPMMAALAVQPHVRDDKPLTQRYSLDFLLLLIWWLYLYLFAVIPWQYVSTNTRLYDRAWTVLDSTEKVVFLVWLASLWIRSQDSWKTLYGHWLAATVLYATSSYIANAAIEQHRYYTGSLYDVPLVASLAWLGALGLLGPKSAEHRKVGMTITGQSVWTARLAMLAVISLSVFVAWSVFGGNSPLPVRKYRVWLTVGTMIVTGLLVFLKQHLVDHDLLRLLHTSQESLTNLKRAQTQLLQSEKLASLGHLVAGAAHELNNPLTAMVGYSQMLVETGPLTPQQRSIAEKLTAQVGRMRMLVASLLNFAKQVPAQKTALACNPVIQTAVRLCMSDPRARNITLELALAQDLPTIFGDLNQLLQVFVHILRNGIEALEETADGAIKIITESTNNSVTIEFLDNGPGIEHPGRVFDPFYTTKAVGNGTGLGLSACYGIIQEHQGCISCQNRAEGGAIFQIELPIAHTSVDERDGPDESPSRAGPKARS